MRSETIVCLPKTSGTEIEHGSHPPRVADKLDILRSDKLRPVSDNFGSSYDVR